MSQIKSRLLQEASIIAILNFSNPTSTLTSSSRRACLPTGPGEALLQHSLGAIVTRYTREPGQWPQKARKLPGPSLLVPHSHTLGLQEQPYSDFNTRRQTEIGRDFWPH